MKKKPGMSMASTKLLLELEHRFASYTDLANPDFNPVYIVTTSLDLRYRLVLSEAQRNKAKSEILNSIKAKVN